MLHLQKDSCPLLFPEGRFFFRKIFRASYWWVLGVEVVFLWRQCSSERQIVMMCWQAHWLFLNQWGFFRQDRENILTEYVLSENARKSPIIPWMIVKPLKMVKTRVVHAGPADDVCRIIWMAWNKKEKRGKERSLSIPIIWNSLTQSAAQRLCTPTIFSPHFFSTTGSTQ